MSLVRPLITLLAAVPGFVGAQAPAARRPFVIGTYDLDRGGDAGCIFEVAPVNADSVRLQLSCNRGAPSYNMGDLDVHLALKGREAIFETTEFSRRCVLRFRFGASRAMVTQEADDEACGFGYAVTAVGVYRRISRRMPRFDLSPIGPEAGPMKPNVPLHELTP